MTVVWPKWPLWTKMTDSHHQNDRYLEFTPKWPLFNASTNYRSFWLEMIPKWPLFEKKTLKWPLFMFERLHWCWRLNVLALFGHDFFKLTVIFIYLKTVVQKTKNKGHFVQNNGHFGITVIVVLNLRSFWYFLTFILVATHLTP